MLLLLSRLIGPAWRDRAVTEDPAGNLKPAKDKSTERIDGIVATIRGGIGRALVAHEEPQPECQMLILR